MKSKTFSIGILSVTAVILFIAQFIPVQTAQASLTLKDRDYSVITAHANQGGEVLYVTNNRTGQIAVFSWDVAGRTLKLSGAGMVSGAFR
jgi:hypothetical protein